ncbi:glycine N-acyltransferase-like [Ptychodera flava]|uniref:glycine N-acyltransferase-like n=1 Tax=Ptychodera flava TaxID=63121 RepID=UPI003969ECD1
MERQSEKYRTLETSELAEKLGILQRELAKGVHIGIKITYLMKHVVEGKLNNFEFVVDSRKEFEDSTIIGRPSKEYDLCLHNVFMYSTNTDHLRYLVTQPGIIDWANRRLEVATNCPEIAPTLHEVIAKNGSAFKFTGIGVLMILENQGDLQERYQNPSLPEGMELSAISQEHHIEEVARKWPYADPDCSPEYIRFMKTQILNLPNICVQKNGELIAWSLQQFQGANGNTFVKPEYRGQGLGSLVTAELAKKVLANGMAACIEHGQQDEVAIKMHAGVGFKHIQEMKMFYLSSFGYSD